MEDRFKFRVWMMRFWGEEMPEKPSGLMHYFKFGHKNFTIKDIDFEKDVLMQCTGLRDKNGKLIYEGDINSNGCVVKYLVGMSGYYLINKGDGLHLSHSQACSNTYQLKYIEIIGNIYENPELLERN